MMIGNTEGSMNSGCLPRNPTSRANEWRYPTSKADVCGVSDLPWLGPQFIIRPLHLAQARIQNAVEGKAEQHKGKPGQQH